jgi:hypothetical protein
MQDELKDELKSRKNLLETPQKELVYEDNLAVAMEVGIR